MITKDVLIKAALLKVEECTLCPYHNNGKAFPFFGANAKYVMNGEAPHDEEIKKKTPFVGKSGNKMWGIFNELNLERDDFIIVNSVMCKPPIPFNKTIGKPEYDVIDKCFVKRSNLLRYIYDVFEIKHILCLGNYARYIYTGEKSGIRSPDINGRTEQMFFKNRSFKITYSVHPASCLYGGGEGDFRKALRSFYKSTLKD